MGFLVFLLDLTLDWLDKDDMDDKEATSLLILCLLNNKSAPVVFFS
jgi:hypothetical protein